MKWQVQYYTQQHNVYEVASGRTMFKVASSVLYTAGQCL